MRGPARRLQGRRVNEHDPTNGWEAVAAEFIRDGTLSTVGVARIREWCRSLPPGTDVLDIGCGPGTIRPRVLAEAGFGLYGVDASPTLAAAYQKVFPGATVACEPVEESRFFGRTFDAALAWGLLFLLPEEAQKRLLHRVAEALNPGGRFLFTAPAQVCTWADLSTGRPSRSLGADSYREELAKAGLLVVAEYDDEGDNHYYDALRRV
jgi:2-polyprenyl-3-methyl-5-hydroxy-6-metoxy-1,4-benzoquinol methylase